jgi:hypothetical protein
MRGSKDGGLHIYKDGHVIAEAWLLPDGSWVTNPSR